MSIQNLKGLPGQWITIRNKPGDSVIFEGSGNAIQFVELAYLHIIGLIFQHQTGNGVNTDDGGTYETPAHHVTFTVLDFAHSSTLSLMTTNFLLLDLLFRGGLGISPVLLNCAMIALTS